MTNKPIWQLAKINNQKLRVITRRKVTERELLIRPYKSVIYY